MSLSMFDGVQSLSCSFAQFIIHLAPGVRQLDLRLQLPLLPSLLPSYPPFLCIFASGALCPLCPQFLSVPSVSSFVKMSIISHPAGPYQTCFLTLKHVLHFLPSPSYLFLHLLLLFLSCSICELICVFVFALITV